MEKDTTTRIKRRFSQETRVFMKQEKSAKYAQVIAFCDEHNTTPKVTGSRGAKVDEIERVMAQFIVNVQSAVNRSAEGELLSEKEFINKIRSYSKYRKPRVNKLNEILSYVDKHKQLPTMKGETNERSMALFVNTNIKLMNEGKLKPDAVALIKQITTFKKPTLKTKEIKLQNVLEYCKEHKHTPKQHETEESVKRMGEFLCSVRSIYAHKRTTLSAESIKLLEEINTYSRIRKDVMPDLISYVETNKKMPTINSGEFSIRKLAILVMKLKKKQKLNTITETERETLNKLITQCKKPKKVKKHKKHKIKRITTEIVESV